MKTRIGLFVLFLALFVACPLRTQAAEPAPARQHPYLFFTKADIPKLKERVASPEMAQIWQRVQATALGGGQGGATSSVMCAGLAYNLTGDRRFADAGIATVMNNTSPGWAWIRPTDEIWYCDLGMATRALSVAYGYDMLYDVMTEAQRAQCREQVRANVFAPYLEAHALYDTQMRAFTDHEGHWDWWTTCYFNWNAWVNGDIGLLGLAMLDDTPEGAKVVEMARASLKCMHDELNQGDVEDGGCDEGPMYWGVVGAAVRFYAALEHVLDTDDGFFELPGTKKTMQYAIDFTAPDGKWANFSDCPDRLVLDPPTELYFLAARYNNPQYMRHLDDNSADWHARPFAILWRPLIPTPPADPRRPVSLYGDVEWAVLNSGSLYLPFKGGDLAANHGQWDANHMMLWVNGERMLNDPGYGNLATADHNTLLVDGEGQHLNQVPFPRTPGPAATASTATPSPASSSAAPSAPTSTWSPTHPPATPAWWTATSATSSWRRRLRRRLRRGLGRRSLRLHHQLAHDTSHLRYAGGTGPHHGREAEALPGRRGRPARRGQHHQRPPR